MRLTVAFSLATVLMNGPAARATRAVAALGAVAAVALLHDRKMIVQRQRS
jgi:hypothetical protein